MIVSIDGRDALWDGTSNIHPHLRQRFTITGYSITRHPRLLKKAAVVKNIEIIEERRALEILISLFEPYGVTAAVASQIYAQLSSKPHGIRDYSRGLQIEYFRSLKHCEQDREARKKIERKAEMYKDGYENRRVRVKYFRDLNGMLARDLATAEAQTPPVDTAKVDELTAQLTELRAHHEDVLQTQGLNLSGANLQIGQLSRETAQLREQLTAKNGECGKLEQQLNTKTGEYVKLEEQLSTKTGEYKKLEDIKSELVKRRSQLQAQLKTSYSERTKAEREVRRLNLDHDKLKGDSEAVTADKDMLKAQLDNHRYT
ncbi:MAG: hypothetical protein Q9191_007445 [Dirinaria sp. TL-2023a]